VLTSALVDRKERQETAKWVRDHPRFVFVPGTPAKLYDSPLRQRIAEGTFPTSEEERLEAVDGARDKARKYGPFLEQLLDRFSA
jgi:hypothetical protein